MNKTIKVIELLNKIANGEEIPKKIKFKNIIFILNSSNAYATEKSAEEILNFICYNFSDLNEEVEIIEDEIDIQGIEELDRYGDDGIEFYDKTDIHKAFGKINEIIQALKEIDKK